MIIDAEIEKLISKGVIEPASHEEGEILSNIFIRPKTDGTHRMILNLKEFNKFVTYHHFKMDTIHTITKLMSKDCYMASIDLKDAYYSIPVAREHRKYLRFIYNGQLYQFTCLPNGLSSCPRKFTKILKPPLTMLHKKGHISSGYIDEIYLLGQTYDDCVTNVVETLITFFKLRFIIHPIKSQFIPSKELITLGFILNSATMTVRLTKEKKESLKANCQQLLQGEQFPIRQVARTIGKIVASFPGVLHGPLYYRNLETDKIAALKYHKGNFDGLMQLSSAAKAELQWWVKNTDRAYKPISHGKHDLLITTDASNLGWGAVCNGVKTGGHWTAIEALQHINYLEMVAIFLGLKIFAREHLYLS